LVIKQKKFQLENFLPYHLVTTADLVSRSLSTVYAKYSLTIPEWRILAHLKKHKKLTHNQLCKFTIMEKARVTRALILMSKKKLVTRYQDKIDKRIYHTELLNDGKKLFLKIEPEILKWENQLSEVLGKENYQNLLSGLKLIEEYSFKNKKFFNKK